MEERRGTRTAVDGKSSGAGGEVRFDQPLRPLAALLAAAGFAVQTMAPPATEFGPIEAHAACGRGYATTSAMQKPS